jgi:hypothetical protein
MALRRSNLGSLIWPCRFRSRASNSPHRLETLQAKRQLPFQVLFISTELAEAVQLGPVPLAGGSVLVNYQDDAASNVVCPV